MQKVESAIGFVGSLVACGEVNVNESMNSNQKTVEVKTSKTKVKGGARNSSTKPSRKQQLLNRSRSFFGRGLFWGAAFTLTATVSATLGATFALLSPLSPLVNPLMSTDSTFVEGSVSKSLGWGSVFDYRLSRPVNILVMGVDRVPDAPKGTSEAFAGRSDTMLLLRFEPNDNSVRMLSIPRDSRVEIPGVGMAKINDANVEGGATLAARTVSKTLNDIPVDRYIRVTTDALQELVDLVGGVEVYVPERMEYTDMTQGLEIDLQPGWQTLDGEQAEQFSRFRNEDGGDIGRVQRQQILLRALQKRLQSPAVLTNLPKIVRLMYQHIDTNLSMEEMLALVSFGRNLEEDDLQMVMLPGRFSQVNEYRASYWIVDSEGRDRVMRQYFDQYSAEKASTSRRSDRRSLGRTRIAIQNMTDDPSASRRVARFLEERDFNNVYVIEDSSQMLRQTEIVPQQGDLEAAYIVNKILGLGRVEASSTGELSSDITIRIGEDWLEREAI